MMPMDRPRRHKQIAWLSVSFEKAVTTYSEAFGHSALPLGAQREQQQLCAMGADERRRRGR